MTTSCCYHYPCHCPAAPIATTASVIDAVNTRVPDTPQNLQKPPEVPRAQRETAATTTSLLLYRRHLSGRRHLRHRKKKHHCRRPPLVPTIVSSFLAKTFWRARRPSTGSEGIPLARAGTRDGQIGPRRPHKPEINPSSDAFQASTTILKHAQDNKG